MFLGKRIPLKPLIHTGILLAAGAFLFCQPPKARAGGQGAGFSFETLRETARALAAADFHKADNSDLPDSLKKLTYDEYQKIRFRPEFSLWKNDRVRFTVQFCQRGYIFQDPVRIHVVDNGKVSDVAFSPQQFDYGTNRVPGNLPPSLQFAGFRLLYPLNASEKLDEVAEFLGGSYFRILGKSQRYGASLRGLAIDTAEPSGEEFPRFTDFWLEKPPQLAGGIRIYALLDSPSVAGAYRFVIEPGDTTVVETETSLFFRKSPKTIGIAPMGSLFLIGQNRTRYIPDYRPQVHDSDGLTFEAADGTWVWRPLVNPAKEHRVSHFPATDLKGFGLMQRDRDFRSYDDLGARFEQRPSYWAEPQGHWGAGTVELVEIPTLNDWNDNIVAYWLPRDMPKAGEELHLTYRLSALLAGPEQAPLLRVRSTRLRPETNGRPPRFVIDLAGNWPQPAAMTYFSTAKMRASTGDVRNLVIQTNEALGGWQVFFDLAGVGDNRTEVRTWLQPAQDPVSETWVYDYQKGN